MLCYHARQRAGPHRQSASPSRSDGRRQWQRSQKLPLLVLLLLLLRLLLLVLFHVQSSEGRQLELREALTVLGSLLHAEAHGPLARGRRLGAVQLRQREVRQRRVQVAGRCGSGRCCRCIVVVVVIVVCCVVVVVVGVVR